MFTGIVSKIGKVIKTDRKKLKIYFTIEVKNFLKNVKVGDSISCDGACLTVLKKDKDRFKVEIMKETLNVTKFGDACIGDLINLELALKIGDRLDGHFVMGHIDGAGTVSKIIGNDLVIKIPKTLIKYVAQKGSVAINGVSLTISGLLKDEVKVSLIEHTLKNTNLANLKKGKKVNIEIDMIARYLEKLLKNN